MVSNAACGHIPPVSAPRLNPAVGVEAEVVSELAGDELVDGETVALAFDVPECDVDGGDEGGSEASVSGGVEFGEEAGPDVVDAGGVFADEELAEVRDCGVDHVGCDAALGLAETGEAFVGLDGQEDPRVARAVADVRVDSGDFHGGVSGGWRDSTGYGPHVFFKVNSI